MEHPLQPQGQNYCFQTWHRVAEIANSVPRMEWRVKFIAKCTFVKIMSITFFHARKVSL
jgi:hypothetical protein